MILTRVSFSVVFWWILLAHQARSFPSNSRSSYKSDRLLRRGWLPHPMISSSSSSEKDTECIQQQQQQGTAVLEFSEEIWDSYVETMTEVMTSKRAFKHGKIDGDLAVQEYLISNSTLSVVPSPMELDAKGVHSAMNQQSKLFQAHYNFTQEQYNYAMRSLTYFGDYCAKNRFGFPVAISWHKLKEAGMIPRENCISAYMYSLSNEENHPIFHDTLDELAIFHDLVYAPSENTVVLRMKNLIAKNEVASAEAILFSLPDKGDGGRWKRLRTFSPVLEYHCETGDASSILRLFRKMRQSPGVYLDADTYAMILGSLARFLHFCANAAPIEGYHEAGFEASHGPKLFDEMGTEMAEDILELTEPAAKQIMDAFVQGFGSPTVGATEREDIPSISEGLVLSGLHVGRVVIDRVTGLCPASGAKLRLFRLGEDQRQHVHDNLLEMARLSYQEFIKNHEKDDCEDQDYGFEELSRFSEWLE